ncbi:MAG: SGNH/GDSL hydrolase family protein [Eubacteriales bacterium]|nr:SGNH/GDSL hydrolase family protein [Eubacteriales bacterium]
MYNCFDYTRPIWKGPEIMHESFLPLADRRIPLLYNPDEIIQVTNAEQTIKYAEGRDYILRDGILYIPEKSAIKIMPWEEYNPAQISPNKYNAAGFTCLSGGYLKFAEGAEFHRLQYAVSYRHSDSWKGCLPVFKQDKLPNTRKLLASGKPFTLAFIGDSIAAGANSSGMVGSEPFAPTWPEMICERLREVSDSDIKYVNKAVGGTASGWGNENAAEFFDRDIPDLLVIAFGMNDASGGVDKFVFCDNCRDIADQIKPLNPECEFIFVSTTLPNPLANQFVRDHDTHEELLTELSWEYGAAADVAGMTSMHKALMEKKRYYDMTGNNINHPNDFLARVYAQTLLTVIIGEF